MQSLAGQRIVVTRAVHQAEELAQPLRALGAEVILLPLIKIATPADSKPLVAAARDCNSYDWIIFASANAVTAFAEHVRGTCESKVAVVGEATRAAAEAQGFRVAVTPEKYVAESLVEAMESQELRGRTILIPSAAVTREVIPAALREMGAVVEVVEAYRTIVPPDAAECAREVFRPPFPNWITLTSSLAVDHAVELLGAELLRRVSIATVGPITTKTLQRYGLSACAEADPHTVQGLVAAITASDMIRPQELT